MVSFCYATSSARASRQHEPSAAINHQDFHRAQMLFPCLPATRTRQLQIRHLINLGLIVETAAIWQIPLAHHSSTSSLHLYAFPPVHTPSMPSAQESRSHARQNSQDAQPGSQPPGKASRASAMNPGTIAALGDQLARAQTALDRERAGQHRTVSLLQDLITSWPAAAAADGQPPK